MGLGGNGLGKFQIDSQVSDQGRWIEGSASFWVRECQVCEMKGDNITSISDQVSLSCLWYVQKEMDTRHLGYCFRTQRKDNLKLIWQWLHTETTKIDEIC